MREIKYDRIVIIGYGKVTGEILEYVSDNQPEYGYRLDFIEHELHQLSVIRAICEEKGIPYHRIEEKKALAEWFDRIAEETLIVSASNNFLFPKSLVDKDNICIINFHNALLPKFPGRNAPSWAIYEGEAESGITWHYVTAGVDEGNIIIQKKCPIAKDTKAYELTETLMSLAYEGFTEIFAQVLAGSAQTVPQVFDTDRKMYRSREIPGGGRFEPTEPAQYIYRLLRSVDYGKNDIFPPLVTHYNGKEVKILRYRKVSADKATEGNNLLYLPLEEGFVLKIKYREL